MDFLAELNDAFKRADYFVDSAKSSVTMNSLGSLGSIGSSTAFTMRQTDLAHHEEQYRHYTGWVYSIVRIIAQRIAGQPLRVARMKSEAAKTSPGFQHKSLVLKKLLPKHLKSSAESIEILEKHHFLQAISQPNPLMVQWSMLFVTIASLELTGRAYWWFNRTEDGLEIWPLPSSWVEPLHEDGQLYSGWDVRPIGLAAPWRVASDDICMFGYPDPANPLNFISPLQANAKAVVADEAIEESQRRSFINGINPGMAIIVGRHPDVSGAPGIRPVLSRDQRNQLIQAIKERYRGAVNNDEPLILDGVIEDAKRITMGPREMDYIGSSALVKERLTQGWGVNPVSMGQLEGANRASSATADDHLCSNVVNPKSCLISQTLTKCVRRYYGDDSLIVYIEESHAVDPDYDLAVETAMVDRGAMSRNEWRARHHLPPVKEGDSAFVGGVEIVLDNEDGSGWKTFSSCLAKSLGRKGYVKLWLKNHGLRERELARALKPLIKSWGAEAAERIQEAASSGHVSTAMAHDLPVDRWTKELAETVKPFVLASVLTGAVIEWELFSPRKSTGTIDSSLLPDELRLAMDKLPMTIQNSVNSFTRNILKEPYWLDMVTSVREDIAGSIKTALERGESGQEAADRIKRLLGNNGSSVRATRIARTETTAALNAGHEATREKLTAAGLLRGKKWLSIVDGSTRPEHRAANNQVARPGSDFLVGGERAAYPGDVRLSAGQRCNCRCTSISVTALDEE